MSAASTVCQHLETYIWKPRSAVDKEGLEHARDSMPGGREMASELLAAEPLVTQEQFLKFTHSTHTEEGAFLVHIRHCSSCRV